MKRRARERVNTIQMLHTRSVTTHKTQIQIVVSFGCLHFEAAFSHCALCMNCTLCCSALCMYILHPYDRSCSFSVHVPFVQSNARISWVSLHKHILGPVLVQHTSYICIAPEDRCISLWCAHCTMRAVLREMLLYFISLVSSMFPSSASFFFRGISTFILFFD